MKNKIDTHIHTNFSPDSIMQLEDLVRKAVSLSYKWIAVTDHIDIIPYNNLEYFYRNLDNHKKNINQLNKKYDIEIQFGAEIGELYYCPKDFQKFLDDMDIEYKIGSVHLLSNGIYSSDKIFKPFSHNEIIDYYKLNLKLLEYGNFDTLGHLGIYKRYYKNDINEEPYYKFIDNILNLIIEKDIALEINYSGLRKQFNDIIPNKNIIRKYLEKGGKLFTLGSDTHLLEHFDDYYDVALKKIKDLGINNIYTKKNNIWIAHKI